MLAVVITMENELQIVLIPTVLLAICVGVFFIGTLLYLYVYSHMRRALYLSIAVLGFLGSLFICCEITVIVTGILDLPGLGYQFHRIQAITAGFFLPALPFFVLHLTRGRIRRTYVLKAMSIAGLAVSVFFLAVAFAKPSLFLLKKTMILPDYSHFWNISRGIPGIAYKIRDILIGCYALACAVFLGVNIYRSRKDLFVWLSFFGSISAIVSGVVDIGFAMKEQETGLFTIRIFSFFSFGITVFTILSMIGVMKYFIDQTRSIEKATKLESLGTLAGGIAHDFNNILTAIIGNIALLGLKYPPESEEGEIIREIENATCKARRLTEQILTFAKGGEPVMDVTSITGIIKETVNFILAGSAVEVEYRLPHDVWNVTADAGQMSQVIQNLILNAREAMNGRGTIVITAANIPVYSSDNSGADRGPFVEVRFRDNGPGIPERYINSVFDPYFTTKMKGNGLGLYICYSIVKNHGGSIDVRSENNQGAEFTLRLPAARDVSQPETFIEIGNMPAAGRILVMEDENALQLVMRKILEQLGYRVTLVGSGEKAVDEYAAARESGDPYDLVIMDLTIVGGMGGRDAARHIRAIEPDAVLVAASGYSNDPVMSACGDYGFAAAIRKPFRMHDLKKTLATLLVSK